mmetsp:Transcript_36189/g.53193  ORF Transcript_36189/g.53193 Transcript_36189/m.53193 type:complete len:175 (+) Transcript_36189:2-526(+)
MGLTHGEVREALMDASTTGKSISLGCSSQDMKAVIHTTRHLSGPSVILNCTADELFCWYRCQPLDDELNTCSDRNLTLECVDSRGQITDPAQHNGAAPACYNSSAPLSSDDGIKVVAIGASGGRGGGGRDDLSWSGGGGRDEHMSTKSTSTGSRLFAWSLVVTFTISAILSVIS